MFIDTANYKKNGKTYTRHLLRNSYRDKKDGKVKHRTIASLNKCSIQEINAIKLALKHKDNLVALINKEEVKLQQGKCVGAISLLYKIATDLGIKQALTCLKNEQHSRLALWQIMSKVIYQGSKLCAYRMSKFQALEDVIGLGKFTKDDIYDNLEKLACNKISIEKELFKQRYKRSIPRLFLYDVTSSYVEGEQNHYAAYGYNRDKKSGKQQIVIGLLTDDNGVPIASRIFEGNTSDSKTVAEQIRTLTDEFGVTEAVMVGDRAMFKLPQLELLPDNFKYITAINKSQIEKLIKEGKIQYDLFDEQLSEVIIDDKRYIFRRNPTRVAEIQQNRDQKLVKLQHLVSIKNSYLQEYARAKITTAYKNVVTQLSKYNLEYVSVEQQDRALVILIDQAKLEEIAKLDGCYCIKTNVSTDCSRNIIHERYKDLSKVEFAFKNMKTQHLELRPLYVRKQDSTQAHVLITTLAYMITQQLESIWQSENIKVSEAISLLNTLTYQTVTINNISSVSIPTPNEQILRLMQLAKVNMPAIRHST